MRQQSGSAAPFIVIIGVLALAALIGLGAVIVLAPDSSQEEANPTQSQTTTTTTPSPTTETTTPSTPSTPTTPSGGYENDDYSVPAPDPNPPAGPAPDTWDEADDYLQRNALYALSAPAPVRCEAGTIDPSQATSSERQTYYQALTACLMRVWAPVAESAGFSVHRPTVTVYQSSIQTKCGVFDDLENAAYCGADGQIYVGIDDWKGTYPSYQRTRANVDYTIAHEFGHLLQDSIGILRSSGAYEEDAGSGTQTALEYSRRLELQADCFAGMFANSIATSHGVTQAERTQYAELIKAFGSTNGDHGSPASRSAWVQQGLGTTDINSCATYNAPASQVA